VAQQLAGMVGIVTGGSRGLGKGIVLGLAEAGATIYVTGRTVGKGEGPWPGSLSETAAEAAALGGQCIAVPCDHADDDQVKALFARVRAEQGKLDVLVNNAFATPDEGMPRGVPFWEQPIILWDRLHTVGLRSHYVASVFAAQMMVPQRRGVIVNVSSYGAMRPVFSVAYGVGKAGVDKLTKDTAHELRPHNVTVLSLWPPFTRTEPVMAQADRWNVGSFPSASPQFTGRAVAALAADPQIIEKTGRSLVVAKLAVDYDFSDLDGSRPPIPAYAEEM
jgi:dehydrogenase/reductase SDR family protein 1